VQVIAVAALAGLKEVLGRMLDARQRPAAPESPQNLVSPENAEDLAADPAVAADAIWRTSTERLADELLTFFVRGVFTRGHALG
jgi:hypothetical protein